jgi:hypothetical protein
MNRTKLLEVQIIKNIRFLEARVVSIVDPSCSSMPWVPSTRKERRKEGWKEGRKEGGREGGREM